MALIPALAAAGSAGLSYIGQREANKTNVMLSREQMDFQERLSNTAYQRSAKDLEKAGLNRILALGSPASSPQGAKPDIKSNTEGASQQLGQLPQVLAQIKNIDAQTQKTQAEEQNVKVNSLNTLQNMRISSLADTVGQDANMNYKYFRDTFMPQMIKEAQNMLGEISSSAAQKREQFFDSFPKIGHGIKKKVEDIPWIQGSKKVKKESLRHFKEFNDAIDKMRREKQK